MKGGFWKNCITWAVACAILLLVYALLRVIVDNPLVFPPLWDCMKSAWKLLLSVRFWRTFAYTLLRTLCAFFISFLFAVVFAVVAYLLPTFKRFFAPIVAFLRSIPTLAVLLIILVWCKAGVAPVLVAFLTLFPALYTGVLSALMQTDEGLIAMSRLYRVPLKKRIFSLYLPSASPYVLREGASALALALKLIASAEVLAGATYSIGGLMQDAKIYLDMPLLFALIAVTCLVGLALESGVNWLAERLERRVK